MHADFTGKGIFFSFRSSGSRITDVCDLPCGRKESNLGALEGLSSSSHSTAVASEKSFVAAFQNWGGSVCQWFNFGFKWEEVLGKAKKQRNVTSDEDEENRREEKRVGSKRTQAPQPTPPPPCPARAWPSPLQLL